MPNAFQGEMFSWIQVTNFLDGSTQSEREGALPELGAFEGNAFRRS